jgi:glycosyltransferase involved in cell wall biosynthesis
MAGAAPDKPGLLFIGNFLSAAGASRGVCEDLVDRLRGAGWTVRAASTKHAKVPRMLEMAGAVWRGRSRDEIVHVDVFSGEAFLWAAAVVLLLRITGKDHVLTLHGGSLPRFAARWPGAVRYVLAAARAVTTPSEFLRREMSSYRSDLLRIPNPLDVQTYPFRRRERLEPRLVWLRAFHETYNPTLAPRVLALLVKDFPSATLSMIGPDRGDGSLARTDAVAVQLGVRDRIQFVGRVPKEAVGEHLSRGDIFLNTTNVDNAPVSVLEALACGLCVVSTDVGGIRDLIRGGEEALLVPPDDPEAMASAIRRALREPELATRLSEGGRRRVESTDWKQVLPQWERLFLALHGTRGVGGELAEAAGGGIPGEPRA